MANPKLAPYGRAAVQVLGTLSVVVDWRARVVLGENVGQAHMLAATGNADIGFVSEAQALVAGGAFWRPPEDTYEPIRQDAVLLRAGADNAAAKALLEYLRSETVRERIVGWGYRMPVAGGKLASSQTDDREVR